MCVENAMQLSLNSNTFAGLKEDFDSVLARTIGNMESKGADEATITLKLGISLTKEQGKFGEDEDREITRPTFKHDISSVMQVKDKKSGSLSGDYELVWDDEEKTYVMRKIKDGQMSLFGEDGEITAGDEDEDDVEYVEAIPAGAEPALIEAAEEEDTSGPEYDVTTPFGYLRQFVGEDLIVTEAMGNYTVRTNENKIILSSASDPDSPFHCDADKLAPHVGHNVVCVGYGADELLNIAIECEDCCETLFSLDLNLGDDEEEIEAADAELETEESKGGYEYDSPDNE